MAMPTMVDAARSGHLDAKKRGRWLKAAGDSPDGQAHAHEGVVDGRPVPAAKATAATHSDSAVIAYEKPSRARAMQRRMYTAGAR